MNHHFKKSSLACPHTLPHGVDSTQLGGFKVSTTFQRGFEASRRDQRKTTSASSTLKVPHVATSLFFFIGVKVKTGYSKRLFGLIVWLAISALVFGSLQA